MYHDKYLKYKNKYLKLQHNLNILNQNGGGTLSIINQNGTTELVVEDSIIRQIPSAESTQFKEYEITKVGSYYRIFKDGIDTKYNYSFELNETLSGAPQSRLQLTTGVVGKQPQSYSQPYPQSTSRRSDESQMHSIQINDKTYGTDKKIKITNDKYRELTNLKDYDIMELNHDDKKYFIAKSMIPQEYLIVSGKGSRQTPNIINLKTDDLSLTVFTELGETLQQLLKDYPITLQIIGSNNDTFYLNVSQTDLNKVEMNPMIAHMVEVYDFTSNYHGQISIRDKEIDPKSNLFLFNTNETYNIINIIKPAGSIGYGSAPISNSLSGPVFAY
jgi:hypothetical protein